MSEQNKKLEKITFFDVDNNEEVELYVIEETTLKENRYLLVAEDDSDESEAYIFKEINEDDKDITFVPVEEDDEYEALIKVFGELVEDTDLIWQRMEVKIVRKQKT